MLISPFACLIDVVIHCIDLMPKWPLFYTCLVVLLTFIQCTTLIHGADISASHINNDNAHHIDGGITDTVPAIDDDVEAADTEAELAALEQLIAAQRAKLQLLQKQKQQHHHQPHAPVAKPPQQPQQHHDASSSSIPTTPPAEIGIDEPYVNNNDDEEASNGWLSQVWSHSWPNGVTASATLALRITRTQLLNMVRAIPLLQHERHKLVANLLITASMDHHNHWCVMIYDMDAPLHHSLLLTINRQVLVDSGWLGTPPTLATSRVTSIATSASPDTFLLLTYNDGSMIALTLSTYLTPSPRAMAARRSAAYVSSLANGDDPNVHIASPNSPPSALADVHLPLKISMIAVVASPRSPSSVVSSLIRASQVRASTRVKTDSSAAHHDEDDDPIGYGDLHHHDDDNDDTVSYSPGEVLFSHIYQRRSLVLFIAIYPHGVIRYIFPSCRVLLMYISMNDCV
jgi:hypothetical protein